MTIKAREIIREFRQGSTVPALALASDNKQYMIKWAAAGKEATVSILADFIASGIGRRIYPCIPEEKFILIDDDIIIHPVHQEVRELILRNRGCNLAIEYLEDATDYRMTEGREEISGKEFIFLIDLLFLNIDRTQENTNILLHEGRFYMIDFSHSVCIRSYLEGRAYTAEAFLGHMKRHPFYSDSYDIQEFLSRVGMIQLQDIEQLFTAIPQELLDRVALSNTRSIAESIYQEILQAEGIIMERLRRLRELPAYSAEARKAEARSNREKIRAAMGGKL